MEEISQDEREKIREEERRKIMKEMKREKDRRPQEVNISLPYFHGKDNVESYLYWEIRLDKKLKIKFTLKSYGSHSYQNKDQGHVDAIGFDVLMMIMMMCCN